jgi:hypothetical protein
VSGAASARHTAETDENHVIKPKAAEEAFERVAGCSMMPRFRTRLLAIRAERFRWIPAKESLVSLF